MKRLTLIFCVSFGALNLGACAYNDGYGGGLARHQKALAGTAIGAAGGALIGGAATQDSDGALLGGLLGGAAGGLVGHSLDVRQRPQPYYYQGGYERPRRGGRRYRHHDDD